MANNNNNKNLNVPNLRFKEFSGEWKKTKIGELASKVGSGVTPRGGEVVYKKEGHPFVRSQNVGLGNLLLDDIAYIDEEIHQKQSSTTLRLGDVLLNITGASIGRSAVVNQLVVDGNVNQHVCIIRPKENACSEFLCNFLLSNCGQKQIDSFQAGGNRQGLNFEQIKSLHLNIPSLREQNKIASFLNLIEERIATQNKIIDKLQSLIKGLTTHIIQMGKPNVHIKDCLVCHTSTLQESDVCSQGTYPAYGANGIIGYTEIHQADADAILIIKDGSGVGKISSANDKFSVTSTLNYLTAKEKYSLHYIYFCLKEFNFQPFKTGMAIPHIYFKDYGNAKIYCPDLEKQCFFAEGLISIESKINIEIEYLSTLRTQKAFLLQQMFM